MIFFQKFSDLLWEEIVLSSDWENLLKFEAVGWKIAKVLRSLGQFIGRVKGQYKFWNRMLFVTGGFSDLIH